MQGVELYQLWDSQFVLCQADEEEGQEMGVLGLGSGVYDIADVLHCNVIFLRNEFLGKQ